jgi:hypothetical protein
METPYRGTSSNLKCFLTLSNRSPNQNQKQKQNQRRPQKRKISQMEWTRRMMQSLKKFLLVFGRCHSTCSATVLVRFVFFNKKYSYFSFVDQARINTMLKLLHHSYPRIVNANFSPYFLQKEANLWQDWQSQILNTVSVKGPNFDANELRTPQVF